MMVLVNKWFLTRMMPFKIALLLLLSLFIQSCTTSVVVEGSVPTPLVTTIPARIGVHYTEEFRRFRYQEVIRDSGTWDIDLGNQNLNFFRNLMDNLFEEVVEVGEPPLGPEQLQQLDGIVIPKIERFGFLTPGISGLKFFSASIEYRVVMQDSNGEQIGDWNIVGYGKSEGGVFSADEALNDATVMAIRDGGARIAIELINQPALQDWLRELDVQRNSSEVKGTE